MENFFDELSDTFTQREWQINIQDKLTGIYSAYCPQVFHTAERY